ncbi:HAMP domain-containing protein [bacterium]|nr:HAMP domain-containing protein [bacterium]
MIGIRQKLILGFGGLLAIVVVIGTLTISNIDNLGQAIDVILRENYRSVVACQDMKEALERMDSGMLFTFIGSAAAGSRLIQENEARFRAALEVERGNITLSGEQQKADSLGQLFEDYRNVIALAADTTFSPESRRSIYFDRLLPLFQRIKGLSQAVLDMNQANMSEANDFARREAGRAHRSMLMAIAACALVAILFSFLTHHWILRPINSLIESMDQIRRGNLDLVLRPGSRDEIGQLSATVNAMAAALRETRRADRINLARTRRATEDVFKALPAAVAVLDLEGRVEVATETARRHFGLNPGVLIRDLDYKWLTELLERAKTEDHLADHEVRGEYIQQFIDGKEYFFLPSVIEIPVDRERNETTGTAVIIKDVTMIHEQQELKSSLVSTVSHQLRTPLTALRMSIHLLLEERVGALNEKQIELLMAAREDSDRLTGIVDSLLDIGRIESCRTSLNLAPVAPRELARAALEQFTSEARDKGVELVNAVPDDLPAVQVDSGRLKHVFANLLSNALRFTGGGGTVTVGATAEAGQVCFSVRDTGKGIPPEHLGHLFEQFYREPGQDEKTGVGLGLAIVKEIVQAHGGEVAVESTPGEGSTFSFTLPLS